MEPFWFRTLFFVAVFKVKADLKYLLDGAESTRLLGNVKAFLLCVERF